MGVGTICRWTTFYTRAERVLAGLGALVSTLGGCVFYIISEQIEHLNHNIMQLVIVILLDGDTLSVRNTVSIFH